MNKKISLLVTDIDGVLTDGTVLLSPPYNVGGAKTLCFKDFDAVSMLKGAGVDICIITGENDGFVDEVIRRFQPERCIAGCKDKANAINELSKESGIPLHEIAYIGDGKYDIPALELAGYGMCPRDAINEVRSIADEVLDVDGGHGCLASAYTRINMLNNYH